MECYNAYMKERRAHLLAMIIPVLIGLVAVLVMWPSLLGPIKFGEADLILLWFGQPAYGLRFLPAIPLFLIILILFHLLKKRGLKVATIVTLIVAAVLVIIWKIALVPTEQEAALRDIFADQQQLAESDDALVVNLDDLQAAQFYMSSNLTNRDAECESYWIISAAGDEVTPATGKYRTANQICNNHYCATQFVLDESAGD